MFGYEPTWFLLVRNIWGKSLSVTKDNTVKLHFVEEDKSIEVWIFSNKCTGLVNTNWKWNSKKSIEKWINSITRYI